MYVRRRCMETSRGCPAFSPGRRCYSVSMRFIVARRMGGRGAGLGNEMIGWSKGFIASQVLDARLVGPSWGLNERKYYRNFRTSRLDFLAEELLLRMPRHTFGPSEFDATGEPDFGKAIEIWARTKGLFDKKHFVVVVEGMYWGYPAVRSARAFLQQKLLSSRDCVKNVYDMTATLDPSKLFVAVHIRAGDFVPLPEGVETRGLANFRIPHAWYLDVCAKLHAAFGDKIQFRFFTDFGGEGFDEAVRRFHPGQKKQDGMTECSDILLMAQADLRICSISTYSIVSNFLSDGPYIWYEPQWILEGDFYQSSKAESGRGIVDRLTRHSRETMSGMPVEKAEAAIAGWPVGPDANLPLGLLSRMQKRLLEKVQEGNLLHFGVVPKQALRF